MALNGQKFKMSPTRLLVASPIFGLWAFSTMAAPLSPEDAASHIGETATVCGVVASAKYEANAKSQPTHSTRRTAGTSRYHDPGGRKPERGRVLVANSRRSTCAALIVLP